MCCLLVWTNIFVLEDVGWGDSPEYSGTVKALGTCSSTKCLKTPRKWNNNPYNCLYKEDLSIILWGVLKQFVVM